MKPRTSIRVALSVLAVLALCVSALGPLSGSGRPATSADSAAGNVDPSPVFTVEAFTSAQVNQLLGPEAPFLRPGDTVDLSRNLTNGTPDVATLDSWASELSARLPSGVRITARVDGLVNVRIAAQELSSLFVGITLDYEPNATYYPNWTWNASAAVGFFENATAICHDYHRLAIAYPTGRPLLESDLQAYGWDYGAIARTVDLLKVQTQTYARNSSRWDLAMAKLAGELSNASVPLTQLSVQVTVGGGPNEVSAPTGIAAIHLALNSSITSVYVWWSEANLSALWQVFSAFFAGAEWPVWVTGSGLPAGLVWQVDFVDGQLVNVTGSGVAVLEPNGSFAYTVGAPAGYLSNPAGGTLVVTGAPTTLAVAFAEAQPPTYVVRFLELGLPLGARWAVTFSGELEVTTGSSLAFVATGGNYSYTIGILTPGWEPQPAAGRVDVRTATTLNVSFVSSAPYSPVYVTANGIAPGTDWFLNLTLPNGSWRNTTSTTTLLTFSLGPGNYSYTAGVTAGGYLAVGGSFTVASGPVSFGVTFVVREVIVLFTESGLAPGQIWALTFGGALYWSTTPTIAVEAVVGGSYAWLVASIAGERASPGSGDSGPLTGPLSVDIAFT